MPCVLQTVPRAQQAESKKAWVLGRVTNVVTSIWNA
jgi:phenylpyruvate tautomerase PptA (4-oxalocrotonate tautomerase family)